MLNMENKDYFLEELEKEAGLRDLAGKVGAKIKSNLSDIKKKISDKFSKKPNPVPIKNPPVPVNINPPAPNNNPNQGPKQDKPSILDKAGTWGGRLLGGGLTAYSAYAGFQEGREEQEQELASQRPVNHTSYQNTYKEASVNTDPFIYQLEKQAGSTTNYTWKGLKRWAKQDIPKTVVEGLTLGAKYALPMVTVEHAAKAVGRQYAINEKEASIHKEAFVGTLAKKVALSPVGDVAINRAAKAAGAATASKSAETNVSKSAETNVSKPADAGTATEKTAFAVAPILGTAAKWLGKKALWAGRGYMKNFVLPGIGYSVVDSTLGSAIDNMTKPDTLKPIKPAGTSTVNRNTYKPPTPPKLPSPPRPQMG